MSVSKEEQLAIQRLLAACEAWYPTFPHDKTWNLKNAIGAWIKSKTVRSE